MNGLEDIMWPLAKKTEQSEESTLERTMTFFSSNVSDLVLFTVAIIMICFGIIKTYSIIFLNSEDSWVDAFETIWIFLWSKPLDLVHTTRLINLPGSIFFIIGGVLILADRRRNFIRSVGIYAMAIGLTRALASIPLIRAGIVTPTGAIGWLMFLMGASLVVSGYIMLSGTATRRMGMMASCLGMLIVYLEFLAFLRYAEITWVEIVTEYPAIPLSCLMFIILMWLIDTDEVRYGDKLTRHIEYLKNIDNTYRSTELLDISDADLAVLVDPSRENWTEGREHSPVEKQFKFQSESYMGTSFVTVQKWKGDDTLYFTVYAHEAGTMVFAERFAVNNIIIDGTVPEDSNTVFFMSDDKRVVQVTIRHPVPKHAEEVSI